MSLGESLPLWSIIPFAGMLLSIAIFPIVKEHWWEKHQLHVAIVWSLLFLIPFTIAYGMGETVDQLIDSIIVDYIPFIVLLLGLYAVSGSIRISGTIVGITRNNVIFFVIGGFLASFIGTTGAAMLFIRPLIRANLWRNNRKHTIIFFILTVANMGGCLTPLGDPPLFLGFLRGVPFFWTMKHIWPILLLNMVLIIIIYVALDFYYIKREGEDGRLARELQYKASDKLPVRIEGAHNVIFLLIIIASVILNGIIPQTEMFLDSSGNVYGITLNEEVHLGFQYFLQLVLILLAVLLSRLTTKKEIRERNHFEWAPLTEVAKLFIGIFITMIPALAILKAKGASLGVDSPLEFFWFTGIISSFLDNSPTYVIFLTTAGTLGASGVGAVSTTVGAVAQDILLAISAGAVFMGALTYIGNAPNLMVRNISEKAGIKMPSFFRYMGWSFAVLTPIFIIDSLIFFL